METLLKKPEIKRDAEGRFEQHGTGLKKTQKNHMKGKLFTKGGPGGPAAGRGRPKGSLNKTTLALKEMILGALDELGGIAYLKTLGTENSSAFASLVGKVLPTTLDASESHGGAPTIQFVRTIVMPDGQRWVEGQTPKQIAPPVANTLPEDATVNGDSKDIKDLEG